ncbi:hypothetical protein L7F22_053198 [Adiantum nelumboides]|nr:hypothetical protein [Adiantum nelumboides]
MPLASDEKVFDRTLSTDAGISSHINDSSGSSSLGRVVVISGGSGYNDLVGATPEATFVMPISDNGGSSSEIIRVLGGPSIGDLRSRLVRLIPVTTATAQYRHGSDLSSRPLPSSNDAIHRLLAYRLPSTGSSRDIKQEWMDILEGRHKLWRGIEPERKECIREWVFVFSSDILRRAHRNFNFRGGSIGNFFLAAAQKFFRSIQSAIFLFSVTTQSHSPLLGGARVLPVINTNHTATIAAELANGETIVGQCEISHPAVATKTSASSGRTSASHTGPATPAESVIFDPIQRIRHQQQQQRPSGSSRLTVGAFGDGLEPSGDEDEQSDDEEGEGEIDDDRSEAAGTDDDDDDDVVDYVQRVSRRHGKRRPRRRSENESRQLRNIVFSKTDGGSDEDGTPAALCPHRASLLRQRIP